MYVLNYSLDAAAHSLDGLSSEWDKRRVYGPSTAYQNARERARIFNYKIQFTIIESFSNSHFW